MLKEFVPNRFVGRCLKPPPPIFIDNDFEYEVEEILNHKVKSKKTYYLIKWLGFGHGENTWEPENNLRNASDLLQDYHLQLRISSQRKEGIMS